MSGINVAGMFDSALEIAAYLVPLIGVAMGLFLAYGLIRFILAYFRQGIDSPG